MEFQIKVLLLSFGIAIVVSLIAIPILKRLGIGQIERCDGPQTHIKKQGTPTMGGLIIVVSIMITMLGIYIYYARKELEVAHGMLPLILVSLGFGLIGFIDDFKKVIFKDTKGLKPMQKIIGLLIISVCFVIYLVYGLNIDLNTYIPFLKTYISLPFWFYIPSAIFVMIATTNAVNLTDGIDGLGISVTTIIVTCLTVIGIIYDVKAITLFGTIIVGCCLGFLLFNLNPAKVFMGDTGSLLLGGAIAGMALYLQMPLILVIIALIPVLETVSVAMQVMYYKRTGNRIFKMAPLHHHFELCGWKENKIVSVFSIATLIMCFIGILSI